MCVIRRLRTYIEEIRFVIRYSLSSLLLKNDFFLFVKWHKNEMRLILRISLYSHIFECIIIY